MSRSPLLALLLLGCATGSGEVRRETLRFETATPLPAGWKRLQTADYELLTDLSEDQAQRAAQLLSQSMLGLGAMFGRAKPLVERKLVVVALADSLDFERRFGKRVWGFAAPGPGETTVCLYGAPDRWFVRGANFVNATDSVLQHELAHAVLSRYFATQPTWFAEGMAQYLETFRWLDTETVLLGEPNVQAWRNYAAVRSLSMKDVLEWDSYEKRQAEILGRYGLAWAFVHYAINREPQRYSALLADLVEGHDHAFERTFGAPSEDLDKAIYAYLKQGQYSQLRLKVPPAPPAAAKFEACPEPTSRLQQLEEQMKPR